MFRQCQSVGSGRIGEDRPFRQDPFFYIRTSPGTVQLHPAQIRCFLHQFRIQIAYDDFCIRQYIFRYLCTYGCLIIGKINRVISGGCIQPLFVFFCHRHSYYYFHTNPPQKCTNILFHINDFTYFQAVYSAALYMRYMSSSSRTFADP